MLLIHALEECTGEHFCPFCHNTSWTSTGWVPKADHCCSFLESCHLPYCFLSYAVKLHHLPFCLSHSVHDAMTQSSGNAVKIKLSYFVYSCHLFTKVCPHKHENISLLPTDSISSFHIIKVLFLASLEHSKDSEKNNKTQPMIFEAS